MPSGLDPQTYLFQNADPTRGYIVLATFSTEPEAEIYAFGAKFADFNMDNSKLLSLVSEIANNPDCATSSNPFTFIEAKQSRYNEILTYGSKAVDCFVEQLRTGENGLQGYIMAVACADITGIGDKDLGADWATAQEWLALYDKSDKGTIIPPVIATDYISDKQAQLLSFGYTSDKNGQSLIACGIAPYQGEYGDGNTLILDGETGGSMILLAPINASLVEYRIYLPDGTVYDDGTREERDSLIPRVAHSDKGICMFAPSQTGEYIYELVLSWPEQGLTVTYGLKIVMTGIKNSYDRAIENINAVYGEGKSLIGVSLVDKYTIANGVSSSSRFLFKIECNSDEPIWVEVSQSTGEIIGEVDDPDQWLVDPPYVENQIQENTSTTHIRRLDYQRVGYDYAEVCGAELTSIYLHGANVLFDSNGMAYEMLLKVGVVRDGQITSGNLMLKWLESEPSYQTTDLNPYFIEVEEDYGQVEGLMSLNEFLDRLKTIEDSSAIPNNLPIGDKPFRLNYGTGIPDELPLASAATSVYVDISTGTANVINESNSGDDYFYIVSKENDQIIGELYILANK